MKKKILIYFFIILLIGLVAAAYNLDRIDKEKQAMEQEKTKSEHEIPKAEVENLLDLNDYEAEKLGDFKSSYDDKVLLGLEPISICKMYLYSAYTGDYETQYELYTTKEGWVLCSKEEYENIPEEHRMQTEDFKVFNDIYNLNVELKNQHYGEVAVITWSSQNGYYDEVEGAWVYFFNLMKDNGIWKVGFIPMQ
jgi:hypothetical protein